MKNENPFRKNQEVVLEIDGMTGEGMGVAHLDGVAFFVPETAEGERVSAHIVKVEKRYCVAKVKELIAPSPNRTAPECEAYPYCGGCTMQHLVYPEQLRQKRRFVADALERLGGLKDVEVLPTRGAQSPWRYRNKGSFPFGVAEGRAAFGFYAPRSHRLIPLFDCPIQDARIPETARAVAAWANKYSVPVYDEQTGKGALRACVVRTAGERVMAVVVTKGELMREKEFVRMLPHVDSLWHSRNDKDTNVLLGDRFRLLAGTPTLTETQDGLTFSVSPQSFLQVNSAQTDVLYGIALDFADPKPDETVFDLYCGIGTISLRLARRAKRVIGVECVPEAIADAKENAKRNGIENAEFLCGLAEEVLPKLVADGARPDLVVLDPPRKGCEPEALSAILAAAPRRIVYVSCGPATLARDLAVLTGGGYAVERVQPVDMFPQTAHVETVCLLTHS